MGEHRGQRLQSPEDIRRAVQRISNKIFREGSEVENAGRLAQLYNVFLKSWELDKLSDIEKRLTAVEEAQRNEKR
jgi:hypothetical protein